MYSRVFLIDCEPVKGGHLLGSGQPVVNKPFLNVGPLQNVVVLEFEHQDRGGGSCRGFTPTCMDVKRSPYRNKLRALHITVRQGMTIMIPALGAQTISKD